MVLPFYPNQFWIVLNSARRISKKKEDQNGLKMDLNWLKSLSNLQEQFRGLPEVEKFFESDYQWIDEVVTEATALFKKNNTQTNSQLENDENDEADASDVVAPVLLPTTPRVSFIFRPFFKNVEVDIGSESVSFSTRALC